jgi:hypothetical protein
MVEQILLFGCSDVARATEDVADDNTVVNVGQVAEH